MAVEGRLGKDRIGDGVHGQFALAPQEAVDLCHNRGIDVGLNQRVGDSDDYVTCLTAGPAKHCLDGR